MRFVFVWISLVAIGCDAEGDGAERRVDAPRGSPADGMVAVDAVDAAGSPDARVVISVSSPDIPAGGVIPPQFTCRGANQSPPLAWSTVPGAAGYALVLTDRTNLLVHSVLYDIPVDVSALPQNVAKVAEPPNPVGSKQPLAYDNATFGYLGPCPGNTHTYEFRVVAVGNRPLPRVTTASPRRDVVAAIDEYAIADGVLTATFTP